MAERILRNTPSTLTFTFYGDGSPVDPNGNTALVNVFKADGTQIVTGAATSRQSVGIYNYALPAQSALNVLRVECYGTFGSDVVTNRTYAEIVGAFLFTIAELRAWDSVLADTVKYTNDEIVDKRNFVEEEFEKNCHRSFTPRFQREIISGNASYELRLHKAEVSQVTKLVVDGVDTLSTAVLSRDADDAFLLKRTDSYWSLGANNIEIEYEYGAATAPFGIVEAAKIRARSKLVKSQSRIDERATSMQIEGFGQFSLATPGRRGFITGIPEVDKTLDENDLFGGMGVIV